MSPAQHIDSLDDPRLTPYRNLKDRELAASGERFIAEGEHVVRRLLASDYPVDSVLCAERRLGRIESLIAPATPTYTVPDPLVHQIVGYKFHSGIIACGRRKPPQALDGILSQLPQRATIVVCVETANTENLGALMRIAAGFGADAMILDEHCCDPLYRQAIRVSMGAVFSLKLHQSRKLAEDLPQLRQRWQIQTIATVLDAGAEELPSSQRPERIALLFGNEAQGLPKHIVQACDRRVTIPMELGTDSLNVAVAAGVFLYHFTR